MADLLDDPRILNGMAAQLKLREARLHSGDQHLGWKVGFGSPAAMEKLRTNAPLVGFLTDNALIQSGGTVSVASWENPVLEPEIAVHITSDLPGGTDLAAVQDAIGAIGPAIELANVDFPPTDIEAILSGNIFNRQIILGDKTLTRPGHTFDGLVGRVFRNDAETARTDDPQALTGDTIEIVAYVATLLNHIGVPLKAGDIIITGSIVPPIIIEQAEVIRYDLEPIGSLTVKLTL